MNWVLEAQHLAPGSACSMPLAAGEDRRDLKQDLGRRSESFFSHFSLEFCCRTAPFGSFLPLKRPHFNGFKMFLNDIIYIYLFIYI